MRIIAAFMLVLSLTACEYEPPADYCADLLDFRTLLRLDAAEICEEYAATTTTRPPPTTTTVVPTPTTSVPPQDICDQVHGVSVGTMVWCPTVAVNLAKWAALTLDNLQWNMDIIDCETGRTGDPRSQNPTSSAAGLYQFIDTWRDARALKYLGRPVVSWYDGPDNIAVGVGLFVDKGASHWPNCGRR